jgi:Ras-related protein Rab-1A
MDEHRRRTMNRVYKDYDAVVFVYDVTNDVSYRNIDNWMAEYDRFGDEGVTRMIVGNKLDFAHKRVTDSASAKRYANDQKMPYLEVSAITAQNIAKMFTTLGREMIAARQEQSATQQKRMNY